MNDYIAALLFFLPAGLANMTPPIANKIPLLNQWKTPLDLGKSWRNKRLLGDNKTWRGLVSGIVVGAVAAVIISKLNTNTVITIAPLFVGVLLGFGALAGDAVESFLKRRLGYKPGQPWFPFDQIDYIAGALLMILPFVALPLWAIATIAVVFFGLHLLTAYLGFLLKLKDGPI